MTFFQLVGAITAGIAIVAMLGVLQIVTLKAANRRRRDRKRRPF